MAPDVGNAAGNDDAVQAGAAKEHIGSNVGDRLTIDSAGNGQNASQTGVARHGGQHRRTQQPNWNQALLGFHGFAFGCHFSYPLLVGKGPVLSTIF